jgi:hypothetical protein
MRVRRKLIRIAHRRRIRRRDASRRSLSDAQYLERLRAGDSRVPATLPGATYVVPTSTDPALIPALDDIFAHRFDILGSGLMEVVVSSEQLNDDRQRRFVGLTKELPAEVVASYRFIEWHSDFAAGYRWNPEAHYLDVPVAPQRGADIKRPRELSRFQHVGVLGAAGRDARLHERAGFEFALQVMDWIAGNPVGRGVNWACAMDVSIRAVNWVWGLRFFDDVLVTSPETRAHIVRSLYEHGLHIEENLDYAREGTSNHYLADVAGLVYIGAALPQFTESDRWLHLGLQELVSEMERQVYRDGGGHEASTSYHRLCVEIFLSCAALAERLPRERVERLRKRHEESIALGPTLVPLAKRGIGDPNHTSVLPREFYESLERAARHMMVITKPNGLTPQIGDNDSGRLHKLSCRANEDVRDHRGVLAVAGALLGRDDFSECGRVAKQEADLVVGGARPLARSAAQPTTLLGAQLFPDAGLALVRSRLAYLLVTCGPNGQNGRGGHGHNDKASFELALGEQDVVVDGGSFVYTIDPDARNRFRSTQAHSTVWVTNCEQDPLPSGIEGLFRLPERSRRSLAIEGDNVVVAEHDGFGATHRRRFTLEAHRLEIEDRLTSAGDKIIGFNLDPSVRASIVSAGERCIFLLKATRGTSVHLTLDGVTNPRIDAGHFSPCYGVRIPNQRILATLTGTIAVSVFDWKAGD